MLLTMMATTGTAWATDVTFSYSDYIGQGTQSSGSSYTMEKTDVSITNTKFYGNNSYAHFYANGTTTITPGDGVTISQIVLTASATNYNGYQSSGTITASTGSVSGNNTTVTWTGSATNAFTISNNKQIRWTSIVVTYTSSGGGSGGSDPTITLSESGTLNIGNYAVSTALDSRTFTVSQSNLSDDITLTATNGGALSPSSIDLNADPTEVTWNFTTPAEAGQFTSVITATSGETSASFTYMGYAYEVHNVNIAQMEHGSVTANPTSTFYYQNVTLTVTPDEGYELDELTVVDANNNPVTVSNNSFKMPNSDVTVSATFVESSGSAVVDELTNANTIGQTTTNYTTWTAIGTSGAEYAGQSAGGNGTIQLRTTNNNSGIVSTSSAGKVKKVIVDWYSGTSNGRTLYIYGSNTAYESPSELYDSSTQGTWLGTIVCGTSTELTISDDYEFIGMRSSSGAMYINEIDITWETSGTPSPSFTISNNDEIAYNATSGSFNFTVNNPVDGGTTTVSENVDWISNAAVSGNSVSFTTTANEAGQARVGVVTLTYTYGDNQTVNKDVTVSQAGNPNVINNISSITASGTFYRVKGTVVAKGAYAFVLGDGTGYIYYYNGYVAPAVNIGEKKVIEGTTGNYGNVIQFTNSAAISASETSNYDGTPEVTVITEVPDYSTGLHLSTYLQFEGQLTKTGNYYYVSVGSSTINIVNPSTDQATTLTNLLNKNVRVKGFFAGNSNSAQAFTVLMESVEEIVPTEPTITVAPATVNAPFAGADGTLAVTYENITNITAEVYFCDAQGEAATYDWITASIDNDNNVEYIIDANDGAARTAYLKVYALDDQANDVYSNIVTINQEEYVAPTYAELPFEFNGGRNDIEGIDGLYQEGLGTDYAQQTNPTTRLKFDNTGDWLLLQFNERPGTLTFDIKGNSFSGSTFKVQTSEDGESYSDLETYTELSSTTQNESFNNLGENVRYIKWIYTEKSNGNVGLGNIALTNYQEQVATPTFTPEGDVYTEAQSVTIACATEGATIYYKTAENAEWAVYLEAINVAETTTIWAYAAKDSMNNSAIATATYTINIPVLTASITVYPLNIEATAAETVDWLAITLENIDITEDGGGEFDLVFCDNDGNPLSEKPAWFEFDFSFNDVWSMPYTILANTETTARTLYFKIYGLGDDGETEAYSDLVTVTQAGYVVDYAELPFEWEGGASADLLALTGVSASQLSGDYASGHAPYLIKFDNTGKYIQVKTDSQPGVVTIGVKMIGGDNTSTITVQGSVDGETFDDGEALEISGNQNDIVNLTSTRTFGENVRYVRLYFTKGSNVGVGPITIAQVDNTPSVSLNSYTIEATSAETNGNLTATYNNIDNVVAGVAYYESDGTTSATYDWFTATINATDNTVVDYVVAENESEERTAYFKVYATVNDENIYSELVTVTQAAYIPPVPTTTYTLATSIESGLHYIITNGTNKAMGVQNNNNRAAVAITIENYATTITEDAGVYEIVINGPDANGKYTIYDKQYPGYLYAASSSSNHLKTRESNSDGDSQWTIEFETAGNVIITATGNNTRNLMRYNNGSTCFSCYDTNNSQQNIYLYVKENDTDYEYYGTEINYTATSVPDGGSLTVGDGTVMTVPNTFENTDPTALIIEDGGQLIHESDVEATVQKGVSGYNSKSGDGWYLISSPVAGLSTSAVATGTYDLFAYDEETAYWWVDHEIQGQTANHTFTTLERGKGYLYANAADVNLNYAGTMKATNANITVDLSYACDEYSYLKGFNLVGNPFTRNITAADMVIGETPVTLYYDFDDNREEFVTYQTNVRPIQPGQGFFIQATEANQQLEFNPTTSKDANEIGLISISAGDENFTDMAYIQFGGGNTLRKMTFSGDKSQVYVMHHHEDYAAATIYELEGSVPVHFVPVEDGFYTITIETKNIENLNYMHLIDNITNTDIDLLAESSYTFKASESDNADRFYLVFDFNNYTGVNENYTNDNFAHQIGDEIFVSGEGTLQVFDVLGRFVTGYNVNGDKRISTAEFNTGVYIFRMVGTEVKTQKIVIR